MTQDTEDVVNYLGRASASPEELKAAQIIQSLSDRINVLEGALKPFAAHVGKSGEAVTLSIGKDTWSHTLTTDDFKRARAALHQEATDVGR